MKLDLHETEWMEKLEATLQSAFTPMGKGQFMDQKRSFIDSLTELF